MKKLIIPALVLGLISAYSCNVGSSGSSSNLIGEWQGVSLETPTDDSFALVQEKMYLQSIDTLKSVPAELASQLGTTNLDSAKILLRNQVQSKKAETEEAKKKNAESMQIKLEKNNDALIKNPQTNEYDTFSWYTIKKDNRTLLFIDPVLDKKPGQLMAFEVASVDKENLKLKVHQSAEMEMILNLKKVK